MENEEKRVITIYSDTEYDNSAEKLKEILKKFDAKIVAANEDEYQIEIAKSKLEDLCNELDLDIDDLTAEWDAYTPEEKEEEKKDIESSAFVGKIDKQLSEFDVVSFLETARQNKTSAEIRLQDDDKVYELYVDFDDKVYIEFWKLDFKHDPESMKCETKLIYETSFDENDITAWKLAEDKLSKFISKKAEKAKPEHERHHETKDKFPRPGFSVDEALALDAIEEASTIQELEDAISFISSLQDIDESTHRQLDRLIAYKRRVLDKPQTEDAEYKYDEKLAKQILEEILEGANADVPQHIDYAISSRGGKVESMRIDPYAIHVIWNLNGFTADNQIYLETLDEDIGRLAEDIAHAIMKTSTADSDDKRHTVNITNVDMKSLAHVCDLLDEASVKYSLTDDTLTVMCGPQQWKTLQSRFSILKGE